MRIGLTCALAVLLFALVGCNSTFSKSSLTWRMADAGPECYANISQLQPYDGKGSLEMVTRSLPGDDAGMKSFVKVYIRRVDGQPLCTLGELAVPQSQLLLSMMRDTRSGNGLPDYAMPYVSLHVRSAEVRRVELIWETAYNGYPPRGGVFPEGQWVRDIAVGEGAYWMRSSRNFNVADGFQPLSAWVDGHVTTYQEASTALLTADAEVFEIELGFGNGVPGHLVSYIDDLRLYLANGTRYRLNFEPTAVEKK